jgi:hypothetical protein
MASRWTSVLLSVVIHDADLGRIAVGPSEDHPPLVVYSNRIETLQIAAQLLQTVRWRAFGEASGQDDDNRFRSVLHDAGVAIHIGPESCAGGREAVREALRGERPGQPLSREDSDGRAI